ncbi:MAG: cyclopropane-fatty-acyl-phospholipid synthase [Spirochaetes bacterium]|nr:cyclopropane-fatty-acyl-phospholipid synthase [Spirochaetota bacterium]
MGSANDPGSNAARITLKLLDELIGREPGLRVGVRLWDGTRWPDDRARPATLVLRHPGALRAMFRAGSELALSEAYLYDDFDVEGDIESIFDLADSLAKRTAGGSRKLAAFSDLGRLPKNGRRPRTGSRGPARLEGRLHSVERDRQAVRYHYDVSNEFYRIFLDSRIVYSCGYFPDAGTDLESAELGKLDLICRKLRLKPGQRLLDIGCGWGGLVMHAARAYGVDATGITLSLQQWDLANERIEAAGLAKTCRVLPLDYREVAEDRPWDALVSVGMFEHVGGGMLGTYFRKAARLLTRGGVFLNHGIASRVTDPFDRGPNFSNLYVFPDGETLPVHVTLRAAEEAGFEVRDVESLREHYALTLRHWVRRLEAGHAEALRHVDEPTYRVWRLYLSGSAHGFTTGRLNVYQALLALPDTRGASGLPLTREDWYTVTRSR